MKCFFKENYEIIHVLLAKKNFIFSLASAYYVIIIILNLDPSSSRHNSSKKNGAFWNHRP